MQGIVRKTDGTIALEQADSREQGYYQCQASNMYGKTMSKTYVLKKAVLDTQSSADVVTLTVNEGDPVKLTVTKPKCFPRPTFSWELATSKVDDKPTALVTSKRILIDDDGELDFCESVITLLQNS